MGYKFARLDTIDNFGGPVVVDADLIEVDLLSGLRVRTQPLEYLNRDRVDLAAQFLRNSMVERLPGRLILKNGKILGGNESRVARGTLPKNVGLSGVHRFIKQGRRIDVQPQCALVLVANPCECFLVFRIENVITKTFNDVLSGSV